ncbi:MAG: hypothetical protein WD595_00255 [Waddliaceae bacterium]
MAQHQFLFTEGNWLGQGELQLAGSKETLPVFIRWEIEPIRENAVLCKQTVEVPSAQHKGVNYYTLTLQTTSTFEISLKNEFISTKGHGLIKENSITWNFQDEGTLEGEEVFTLQNNGEYHFNAEFFSAVQQETRISGRIWKTSNV